MARTALLCLVLGAPLMRAAGPSDPRPNIVLIVLDTVRADAVGPQPGRRSATPFLDQVAAAGLRYRDAVSPSDATPSSHFSMLTGYPAGAFMSSLDIPDLSVLTALNAAGYETIGVSANPNVDPATMACIRPFQTFVASPYVRPVAVNEELYGRILRYGLGPPGPSGALDFNLGKLLASAETMNEELAKVLSECEPARSGRPLFLFLNLLDAHDPYVPPASWGPSPERLARAWPVNGDLRAYPVQAHNPRGLPRVRDWQYADNFSEEGLGFLRELYEAGLRHLDGAVKRTFELLEAHGLLKRSIVVITSDHGEALGEHGYLSHSLVAEFGVTLEENYRVPLIVRGFGLDVRPIAQPAERVVTTRLAESIRSWAQLAPANAAPGFLPTDVTLNPLAQVLTREPGSAAASRRVSRRPAARRPAAVPVETKPVPPVGPDTRSAEQRQRDEELMKRLRSLGYLH